jgi:hypothetical protein
MRERERKLGGGGGGGTGKGGLGCGYGCFVFSSDLSEQVFVSNVLRMNIGLNTLLFPKVYSVSTIGF